MSSQGLLVRAVGKGSPGGMTIMLLHGFGAPGDDLVDLARYLEAPPGARFLFPAAPLELPGLYGDARAWWMIDPRDFERGPRDLASLVPDGLVAARALVTAVIERALAEHDGPLVLGGFSQGAMLSLDTALHLPAAAQRRLAGLLLMSGTPINGAAWAERLTNPGPITGLPILVSHGRADPLLSFAAAERMRDQLAAAGAAVEWVPFPGGHEIPPPVLAGANRVLAATQRPAKDDKP